MAIFTKRMLPLLWALTLCIGMLGVTAFAVADPVSATFQVNTAVSGEAPDTPETFTVELRADKSWDPMPQGAEAGVYTLALKGADSASVTVSFDRVGEYHYTLRQLPGNNPDCYLDPSVYRITVYVTSGGEEGLRISASLTKEGLEEKQEKVSFSNRYACGAAVTLGATKTLDGRTPNSGAFSFVLRNKKGEVLQRVRNDRRKVEFAPMRYYAEGIYTYTVMEETGTDGSILYDGSKYVAEVTVTKDDNGDYRAQVTYKLSGKALEGKPAFVNRTRTVSPATGDRNRPGLWLTALLLSGAALTGVLYFGKRKKKGAAGEVSQPAQLKTADSLPTEKTEEQDV